MSTKPLKILACGDVKGQIGALIKRVETVNKKAGPFEMVLCVGQFFNETPGYLPATIKRFEVLKYWFK